MSPDLPITLTLLHALARMLENPQPTDATWTRGCTAAATELVGELSLALTPRDQTDWYENLWRRYADHPDGEKLARLKAALWERLAADQRIITNLEIHLENIEPCPHPNCLLQSHLTTFLKQDGRGSKLA